MTCRIKILTFHFYTKASQALRCYNGCTIRKLYHLQVFSVAISCKQAMVYEYMRAVCKDVLMHKGRLVPTQHIWCHTGPSANKNWAV